MAGWGMWWGLRSSDWLNHYDQVDTAVVYICRYGNGNDREVRGWTIEKITRVARKISKFLEKEFGNAKSG